jgi:Electron transfer DM13
MPTATRLAWLRTLLRKPVTWIVLAATTAAAVVALALFQPWKLWVDETVNEAAPAAAAPSPTGGTSAPGSPAEPAPGSPTGPTATGQAQGQPVALAQGDLISHEHDTTGIVRVIRLPDGSRVLRLENLDTSNGPDLKVWLTDARVVSGRAGWHVFDDGEYVNLGRLKGNKGSQNYPLPADLDLSRYSSVSIWCDRFNVSFGAATLTRA